MVERIFPTFQAVKDWAASKTELSNHGASTSGVHGVGASNVESESGAQSKVDGHEAKDNPHTDSLDVADYNPEADTHSRYTDSEASSAAPVQSVDNQTGDVVTITAEEYWRYDNPAVALWPFVDHYNSGSDSYQELRDKKKLYVRADNGGSDAAYSYLNSRWKEFNSSTLTTLSFTADVTLNVQTSNSDRNVEIGIRGPNNEFMAVRWYYDDMGIVSYDGSNKTEIEKTTWTGQHYPELDITMEWGDGNVNFAITDGSTTINDTISNNIPPAQTDMWFSIENTMSQGQSSYQENLNATVWDMNVTFQ